MLAAIRSRLAPWPRLAGAAAGTFSALLGLVVLAAWAAHSQQWIQVLPTGVPMQRNTALEFVFLGLALTGAALEYGWIVVACAAPAEILAATTALNDHLGFDLSLYPLWGHVFPQARIPDLGHMA